MRRRVGCSNGVCLTGGGREIPAITAAEGQSASPFFHEIVGLRIYVALWVAIGHGLQLSGFMVGSNPVTKFLLSGHAAVVVFMIVSGFVITNLLLGKQESYPRYIVRRFFRLYPAYVVCCIAGYLLTDDWLALVREVPWQDAAGWRRYVGSIAELDLERTVNFWPHFGLHATMLHGVVPDQVLNRAAMTFLPVAWSISLEWQFYLVAPLVIAATGKGWRLVALALAALALHMAYHRGWLGAYDIGASLAGATPYFAVGIASRLAFGSLSALRLHPLPVSAVTLYATVVLVEDALPFAVWAVFYCYLLWHGNDRVFGPAFRLLTTCKPALVLGEASYSLYLVHRPIQVLLGSMAIGVVTLDREAMLVVQMVATGVALPVSIALYWAIERPGIAFGRRVAKRLPASPGLPVAARS